MADGLNRKIWSVYSWKTPFSPRLIFSSINGHLAKISLQRLDFQLECFGKWQLLKFWSPHPPPYPALAEDPDGPTCQTESPRKRVTTELFLQRNKQNFTEHSWDRAVPCVFFCIENKNANVNILFSKAFCSERKHGLGRKHYSGQLWFTALACPLLMVSPWTSHSISVTSSVEQDQYYLALWKSIGSS